MRPSLTGIIRLANPLLRLTEMLPIPTVRASLLRAFVEYGQSKGLDTDVMFDVAGVPADTVEHLDQEVSAFKVGRLLRYFEMQFPNVSVGMNAVQHMSVSGFGAYGYAIRHCATLRESLYFVARYVPVFSSHARVFIHETPDVMELTLKHHPVIARLRHPAEIGFSMQVRLMGHSNIRDGFREVRFFHKPTGPIEGYRTVFGVDPVFEAGENKAVLAQDFLDRPMPHADPAYHSYLSEILETMQRSTWLDDPSVASALQRCIDRQEYTVAALADHSGMNERTLHRRLTRKGTTASILLNQVRNENASRLLTKTNLPVAEVAFLLGFSDQRTFLRAFKRWNGETPSQHRKRQKPVL